MKPNARQRQILLSLADQPARRKRGYYRLLDGLGNRIHVSTVVALLLHGWAAILVGVPGPGETEGNGDTPTWLVATPKGLEAVRKYL